MCSCGGRPHCLARLGHPGGLALSHRTRCMRIWTFENPGGYAAQGSCNGRPAECSRLSAASRLSHFLHSYSHDEYSQPEDNRARRIWRALRNPAGRKTFSLAAEIWQLSAGATRASCRRLHTNRRGLPRYRRCGSCCRSAGGYHCKYPAGACSIHSQVTRCGRKPHSFLNTRICVVPAR